MSFQNYIIALIIYIVVAYCLEYMNNKKNPDFTIKNFIYKNIANMIALCVALFVFSNMGMGPKIIPFNDIVYTDDPSVFKL
jgi:hypothetical protein